MIFRYPREHFTTVLRRICTRLDRCNVAALESKDAHCHQSGITATVTLRRLWVFGSYLTGVLDCRSLDLVAETSAQCVPVGTIKRTFLGHPSDTILSLGTPENGGPGFIPDRYLLLWDGPGCDWRKILASIAPDPSAKPYFPLRDQIPLRSAQVNEHTLALEAIVKAHAEGTIKWTFCDLPSPLSDATTIHTANAAVLHAAGMRGPQCLRIAPHVVAYMHARRDRFGDRPLADRTQVRWGGCNFYIGRARVPIDDLDHLDTYEIDIVPYVTRHGPNGIWSITRGPRHPIWERLAGREFFTVPQVRSDAIISPLHAPDSGVAIAYWAGIFTSERLASIWARQVGRRDAKPVPLEMDRLLALLAAADVVSVNDRPYCRTDVGAKLLRGSTNRDSSAAVMNALAPCH